MGREGSGPLSIWHMSIALVLLDGNALVVMDGFLNFTFWHKSRSIWIIFESRYILTIFGKLFGHFLGKLKLSSLRLERS